MKIRKFLMTSAIVAFGSSSFAAEVISPEEWKLYQEGINPGEVFAVEVGGKLFNQPMGPEGKSCASCHTKNGEVEEKVATAAAYYPKYDPSCGKVINLEQRIQLCQAKYQKIDKPFSLKSKENVALTTYLFYLAAGTPINVDITSPQGKEYYEYGREIFTTKRGKRNLSCQVCHEFAAGKILRMQPLYPLGTQEINGTPGRASASLWPAFRMTKNKVQTLQQRFIGCQKQAGQKPLPLGSKEMVALEVYVKSLANGVELKTPGLRR